MGRPPEHTLDKLIAAAALIHDLMVVTRNVDDFSGNRGPVVESVRQRKRWNKRSGEIDLKFGAVCAKQGANFVVDGFLCPGNEVTSMVFSLLPNDLDKVEFEAVGRQVEQLHAMLA
jgi:hypothetical protein